MLYWGQIKSVRYRDEILRPVAVPLVQQRNLILQQDNARPHVARVCQDFLANNNIAPLAWPPYSPDLTPIEVNFNELFSFEQLGPGHSDGSRKVEYSDTYIFIIFPQIHMLRVLIKVH